MIDYPIDEDVYLFLVNGGLSEREARAVARARVIERALVAEGQHHLTAAVMGGDIESAERADRALAAGEDPEDLVLMVGSYARFGWALAHLPTAAFQADICTWWAGADPDDTDPKFLAAWEAAWEANGRRLLRDGRGLPKGHPLVVYRGQMPDETHGLSWTLDVAVARKFATGAAVRRPMPGVVLTALVQRRHVMAYITGRNESEVIVAPRHVMDARVIEAYALVPGMSEEGLGTEPKKGLRTRKG